MYRSLRTFRDPSIAPCVRAIPHGTVEVTMDVDVASLVESWRDHDPEAFSEYVRWRCECADATLRNPALRPPPLPPCLRWRDHEIDGE